MSVAGGMRPTCRELVRHSRFIRGWDERRVRRPVRLRASYSSGGVGVGVEFSAQRDRR